MIEKLFQELIQVIKTLRGPNGCPWDKAQTIATAKDYILEEAYELLDAVERKDHQNICEEAGDLLFQVMFLINLEEEIGTFGFEEVLKNTKAKMVRRHPHVFENASVSSVQDVISNWEKIKEEEKKDAKNQNHTLPSSMPGSMKLLKVFNLAKKKDVPLELTPVHNRLKDICKKIFIDDTSELSEKEILSILYLSLVYAFLKGIDIDLHMRKLADNIFEEIYSTKENPKTSLETILDL